MLSKYRLLTLTLTLSWSPVLILAQSDTTPPSLTALTFGASTVDVSSSAQSLTVNATITDDLSGVSSANIQFRSPSGQTVNGLFFMTSGTNLNGTYQGSASFPLFVEAGVWTATVSLFDNAGNRATLQVATLASLGFPSSVTVVDTNADTTPPTLLGMSFSPSSIDTSAGPQNVTVSLQISDAQSGADFSHLVTFALTLAPTGSGPNGPFQYLSTADFKLVSGTPQDGVWQATKQMPQFSGGAWEAQNIILFDAVTNQISLGPAQLLTMGIAPILADTSTLVDSTPPLLSGLTFSPTIVNTSPAPQNVAITVSASDDISGLDFTPTTSNIAWIELGFNSPSGNQFVFVNPFTPPVPQAGTPLAGSWTFTANWPQFSEQGTWNATYFRLQDKVGNIRSYSTSQLQSMGFASTLVITKPSLAPDGTIGSSGGTVVDNAFGSRASITFPPGLVSAPTTISIDVFPSALSIPTPRGFTMPGTYFENLSFVPALPSPVPAPGITVVLPLLTPMAPGAQLSLYHIDPVLGLSPAMNAFGNPVVGTVDPAGLSATFNNVVTFSTVVAYLSTGSTLGDVNGDGAVNCADVSIVKSGFGKHTGQAGYNVAADLSNDGTIDIRDLFIVTRQLPKTTVCH